jgi:cellulose synthase operon protein C
MRRLNVRLLVILVAGLVLLGGGVYAVHRIQTRRHARALLRQTDLAEKTGDSTKAMQYLERYLAYVPNDVNALRRFAELRAKDNPIAAVATLEKVLVLEPGWVDVRRRLVDLYVLLGTGRAAWKNSSAVSADLADRYASAASDDFSNALAHLEILAPANEPPDRVDAGLQLLRGRCQEGLGHPVEAAIAYEKARKRAPEELDAYTRLAILLRQGSFRAGDQVAGLKIGSERERVGTADRIMDELIARNGQSALAYLGRARYRNTFELPGAADDASHALQLAPENADVLATTAWLSALNGESGVAEARRLLKRGIELHPDDPRMYELLARIETAAGKPEEAIAYLKTGVDRLPAQVDLNWLLADTLIEAGKTSEAAEAIERLGKVTFNPLVREFLQARLDAKTGQWRRAAMALERIAPILAARDVTTRLGKSAYVLLGQCYGYLNEPDRRLATFRRAADIRLTGPGNDPRKVDPLNVEAQAGLAAALDAGEKVDEAIEQYRKILAQPGVAPAIRINLARLLILRELRLPEARRNWTVAKQVLDEVQKAMPGRPEVTVLRAEVLAAQKQLDEACTMVKAARDSQPERPELWVELASLEQRRGHPDEALRLLDEAEKRLGPLLPLRNARVRYWATRGGPEAAAALSELEKSASGLTGNDRKAFLGALFDAYTRSGDAAHALDVGRQRAQEDPTNLTLRLTLFERALQDGDEAGADALVREISKIETASDSDPERSQAPLTGYCQAILEMRKGNFDEARSRLHKVAQLRTEWSRIPLVEAQINERGKPPNLEQALINYLRAIDMGEHGPLVVLRAAELLSDRGRYAQADLVLQRLEGSLSVAGDQQRVEIARALAQARTALVADKNDYRNHLKLGQVLYLAGQQAKADGQTAQAADRLKEAEAELRQTLTFTKAKDQPDAYVALVQVLAFAGRFDDAKAVAAAAEQALPRDQHALRLAQCYLLAGDPAKVKALCHDAVERAPEDPVTLQTCTALALRSRATDDAENYLDRLTKLAAKAPREAADARRVLALIKAARGGPRMVDEALRILAENRTAPQGQPGSTAGGQSVEDRRAKARVLALYPIRERRREAIAILETLAKEGAATPDDQTRLYALYESDNDWPKARDLMQRLLASDQRNSTYPALFALSLIRHGEPAEAAPLIAQLGRLVPDSPAVVELKARLLVAQGHKDEAVQQVLTFARGQPGRLLPSARLLAELGLPEPAELLYQQYVAGSKDPQAPFELAGFLARRGRLKDALDLCERAWPKSPPDTAAHQIMQVLSQASSADDVACRRVASWIDDAIHKNPGSQTLQFARAYLYGLQRKYEEAERIYREIAAREKTNGAVLNNLAWLLCFQKGREAEALAAIRRVIELDGELSDFVDTRALAYMALGQFDAAVRDMENSVATGPAPEKYFHLALAYRGAGKNENARPAFQKAKELGLTRESLHPLERPGYDQLASGLPER